MEYVIIALLIIIVIVMATKYFLLKKQIKSVIKQLDDESTKLVTTQLIDDDLSTVVLQINGLLEKIQQTIIKENISTATLKSSIVNISHDMKTPLTAVIGYLQLMDKECLDKQVKEMIQICLERTQYCNSLINDFFELSMIEAFGCNPNMESIDVTEELCEQILVNYPLFQEKGITPHFDNSDKAVIALADRMMLRRMIQNLISNAIKYSAGDIYFTIEEDENVVIRMTNPVSDKIDTEHIFDKFYMQDKSRHNGCGIGLYLCKEFAQSMQGSISARMQGNNLEMQIRLLK